MPRQPWNSNDDDDDWDWPEDSSGPEYEMYRSQQSFQPDVPYQPPAQPGRIRRRDRGELSRCLKCGVRQKLDWYFVRTGKVYSERRLIGVCPNCEYEETLE